MINLAPLLQIAVPIAGALLTEAFSDNSISPKKSENIYRDIVPFAVNNITKAALPQNINNQNTQVMRPPMNVIGYSATPYEIARNKQYKYNF